MGKASPLGGLAEQKGTTWRNLSPEEQANVTDAESANAVLLKNNSMIKRPLIVAPERIVLGFDEREYVEQLRTKKLFIIF